MKTRTWNTVLWTAQGLFGALFGMAGAMKMTTPLHELQTMIPWVADAPALARFVGTCELLGALGLLLPSLLRIRPMLAPLAAIMLGLVMVAAMIFHTVRGEYPMLGVNAAFFGVLLFIAYGRSRKAVLLPRNSARPLAAHA